jgi:hypothetical protein
MSTSLAAKANTADLAPVATSGAYADVTGTPTLAPVATSGAYSDLTGTPTLPSALTDLSITDGTAGQVLSADGDGTYTFIDAASGGGGSFEAVASGSISDGAPTVLNADGTVAAVAEEATTPSLLQTLNNPSAYSTSLNDYFGWSVAISGSYAIVGAYWEDDAGGTGSGKAYIFDVTTGAVVHTLDNPNAYGTSTDDYFGDSVAISGNYAIVGAYNEDDAGGTASGKAYIYNVTTGALLHTLDNPNPYGTSELDRFGWKVAATGNYAIVGAYLEADAGGTSSGKVYIFDVTTGALVRTLDNPNAYNTSTSDNFGYSVAASGNYAIIGAHREDDAGGSSSGKAYIYNVTTGALLHTLDNPNAYSTSQGDNFGYSVSISGNYAIVGASNEDDAGGTDSGKAYIYNVTTGALLHTLDNPNAYSSSLGDYFGDSVAISGNYAIVGASFENHGGGIESGKAYIFDVTSGALVHTYDNPNPDGNAYKDRFGYSVAISDNYVIAGAFKEDDAGITDAGKAYIYSVPTTATNLTAENYAGIADAAYSDAATATIQTAGSVDDAQSGLTPGQAYYVQGDGTLGLDPGTPSVFAGTAVSATSLLIGKQGPAAAAAAVAYADVTGTPTLATVATTGAYSDLTGTPTGLATETYVDTAVNNLVDTAPDALNTLNELAAALNDDADFAGTVTTSLAAKANTADLATVATTGAYSDLTGTPTVPAALTDLNITDGTAGQVLSADGDGTYTFIDAASGSSGSGGTASFTSITNLTAGDLVALSTSGTVSGISTQEQVLYSSPVQPVGAQTKQYDNVSVARISDTKYVVAYRNSTGYPVVYIATVEADNTVTTGTQYTFSTATNTEGMDLFWDPVNERGVVVSTAVGQVRYQYFSVVGTAISYQGMSSAGQYANKCHAVYNYETNEIWVAWLGENYSARYGGLHKAVWNGSTIDITNYSIGFTLYSEKSYNIRALTAWGTDKVIGQWYDGNGGGYREIVFDTSTSTWNQLAFTSDIIQDLVYNSTDDVVLAINYSDHTKWWEYSVSGGVVSKGSFFPVAADVDGNPITWGTNDVIDAKFINGKTYILSQSVYEQAFMYSLERIAQNTYNIELIFNEAVPGSYDTGRMARDSFAVCGSGIVYVEGLSLRKLSFADLSVTNIGDFIGISTETVTANNPAVISIVGGINTNQSGLTPKAKYYATAVGALTTTLTDYPIGIATSATSLLVTESYTSTQKKTDLQLATIATTGAYSDLTGTPTGLATETYVTTAVSNLVDTAPEALNTLNELAAALGDDANFAGTVTTSLAAKANTADLATVATTGAYSDLTGTPTVPAALTDLNITDGTAGQVLSADGDGTYTFIDAASGGGGGGSFEAVASGSISDGAPAVLNADGTVSVVAQEVTASLLHTLDNPNPIGTSTNDYFGYSVATSDNYVIVGAYGEWDVGDSYSGKAFIFDATTGALLHTLDNPNPYGFGYEDFFGWSVAISGNYAIVSAAYEDDAAGTNSGKAYIYNVTTGALLHTLDNPNAYDTSADDNFGAKVAISGNYAIVSASEEDDAGGSGSGKAYIYNVTTGALLHTLDNPNAYGTSASDEFGQAVAISGNYAIVSAAYEDDAAGTNSGKAYIFDVTTGALVHTYDNPNPYGTSQNDYFGGNQYLEAVQPVAISGNYAIVGAYFEDDAGGNSSGKAYIFNLPTAVTNLTAENYAGIADAAYSDAATATIQTAGSVDDAQSGLTPGQAYYVQGDGTLGLAPGTTRVFAGVAASATKLLIGKEGPAATVAYADVTDTPTLAAVATTGAYSDLTGNPTELVTAGTYSQGVESYVTKQYVLNGTTTDATEGELLIVGTTSRVPVSTNSTMLYEISIAARRTDVTGESASWNLKGCIDNFSGTVTNVGNIYEIAIAADDISWSVDAQADDTNNALNILVTGAASKNIRWTAVVKTIEVSG